MRRASTTLATIVLSLLAIGIVMLASVSSVKGTESFADPYYFLKRQLIWLLVSALVGLAIARFDYHWWQRLAMPALVGALTLLALVFVPKIGMEIKGSARWLRLGPMSLQPSETAKFAVIVAMSAWMSAIGPRTARFREGLLAPLSGLGVVAALILREPDFGTTVLIVATGMLIMFVGGTRVGYLLTAGALGAAGFLYAVMRDPVRAKRILAFLMPEKYPDVHYHLAQSKIAFVNGGLFGVGLGNSIQKHLYLPEAHTDFIFAIIGEELGLAATWTIVALFLGILVCGTVISFRAPDKFGKLLSFGAMMTIVLQAAINMGVVTGCLPTKGIALPFISYGGSSLLASTACVALLMNVASHAESEEEDVPTRAIRDGAHRFSP
ncbi:MAG: putative lipid II flippase FtsW [Verrucomicrobiota bacterium]|nr:putative lipid II flippase FtsW [Verrucomicrobiota bacterium]